MVLSTKKTKVDFLGIGVQKSATTWLFEILRQHDDIWMPPRKELHYFDRSLSYPSPSILSTEKLNERLTGNEKHNKLFRIRLNDMSYEKLNTNKVNWYHKYYFSTYNDDWYRSLFDDGIGKIKGEITPAYSILNKNDIKHIKSMFPDLKIILILRNPIERVLSQIKYRMTKKRLDTNASTVEIKNFIDSSNQEFRSDYLTILDNWEAIFPKNQMFIGFYDEIASNPKSFIEKVFNFLEVKSVPFSNDVLTQKINTSIDVEMPEEIIEYVTNKYYEDIKRLSGKFGGYPKLWLDNITNGKD